MHAIVRICAAIQGWWFVATPALCLGYLTINNRNLSATRIWRLVVDASAITLVVTDVGWYAGRHIAATPIPALWSAAIDIVPTLVVFGSVFLITTRQGLRGWRRGAFSLGASYVAMFLCAFPAVLVFVQLGGDYL